MKRILLLLLFIVGVKGTVYAQGIEFKNFKNWEEVKLQASRENKFIFIDVYATWCQPCKIMDDQIFTKPDVGEFFNDKFINIKIQIDSNGNDDVHIKSWYREALEIRTKYNIRVLPAHLFFSPDGTLLQSSTGLKGNEEILSEAKKAVDPNNRFDLMFVDYKNGKRDADFVMVLARTANDLGEKAVARDIAQKYINNLSDLELFVPKNIKFMFDFTKSSSDRGFAFFRDNATEIEQKEPTIKVVNSGYRVNRIIYEENIQPFLKSNNDGIDWKKINENLNKYGDLGKRVLEIYKPSIIVKTEIDPFVTNKDTQPDWAKIKMSLKKYDRLGDEIFLKSRAYHAINKGDFSSLIVFGEKYFSKYPKNVDSRFQNDAAWGVFENCNDVESLNVALKWAKSAIEKMPTQHGFIDTYANLLYKMGKTQRAIEIEQKALSMDPANEEYKLTLDRMKNNQKTWP